MLLVVRNCACPNTSNRQTILVRERLVRPLAPTWRSRRCCSTSPQPSCRAVPLWRCDVAAGQLRADPVKRCDAVAGQRHAAALLKGDVAVQSRVVPAQ